MTFPNSAHCEGMDETQNVQNRGMSVFRRLPFNTPGQAKGHAFLGGGPYLPDSEIWPIDSKGNLLLHLASFPASFIRRHAPQVDIADGLCISVFTPYDKVDYHYIEVALMSGGKLIAYAPADVATGPMAPAFSPVLIGEPSAPAQDHKRNEVSKVGGVPAWLQDEELHGLEYVLQINELDLDQLAPTHKAIFVGGIGYRMLKKNIHSPTRDCGHFVIQTT